MSDTSISDLIGKEAPVITNESGGMQSKTAGAFYQLPGFALQRLRTTFVPQRRSRHGHIDSALDHLIKLLQDDDGRDHLGLAFAHICLALECDYQSLGTSETVTISSEDVTFPVAGLIRVAQVMDEGAKKYARGNWRLIPYWSQIDHALQHVLAIFLGDEGDDHIGHVATRLAFAIEVEDRTYRFTGIDKKADDIFAIQFGADAGEAVEKIRSFQQSVASVFIASRVESDIDAAAILEAQDEAHIDAGAYIEYDGD